MMKKTVTAMVAVLALAGCGGADETVAEPDALTLTPGEWAANDERASYADEDGNLMATFRCDAEVGEVVLEMTGGFAEDTRPAMLVRAGDFMHGVDPVEVRQGEDGPVRLAPIPLTGPLVGTIREFPAPLTIESEGAEPIMIETDEVLQRYFESCAAEAPTAASEPAESGQ